MPLASMSNFTSDARQSAGMGECPSDRNAPANDFFREFRALLARHGCDIGLAFDTGGEMLGRSAGYRVAGMIFRHHSTQRLDASKANVLGGSILATRMLRSVNSFAARARVRVAKIITQLDYPRVLRRAFHHRVEGQTNVASMSCRESANSRKIIVRWRVRSEAFRPCQRDCRASK